MHFFSIGALVLSVVIIARDADAACAKRGVVEKGRRCKKECKDDGQCIAPNKRCGCDGACGMSCFNPNATCEALPQIKNGNLHQPRISIGATASYRCHTGFGLRGGTNRTCAADKKWYPDAPTCEDITKCGRSWPKAGLGRVVGGKRAHKDAWPWQVLIARKSSSMAQSLQDDDKLLGGGSILNQRWVLTAAHVFEDASINGVAIFAGINERPGPEEDVEEDVEAYSIQEYHEHDEFNAKTYINDIALLKVERRLDNNLRPITTEGFGFTFGDHIKPICLPCTRRCSTERYRSEDRLLHSRQDEVIVTGFGQTRSRSTPNARPYNSPSRSLQQAPLQLASSNTCQEGIRRINSVLHDSPAFEFPESLLCCEASGTDACDGDSGGPLVREVTDENTGEKRWIQIGIVSFGYGCASDFPSYFTRVASFIPWITGKIEERTCVQPIAPENGFIRNQHAIRLEYGSRITYGCSTGFMLEGSETGTCQGGWGELPNCTLNLDCDFQDSTRPTCGYTNENAPWRRVRVYKDGLPGYVIEGRYRRSILTSAIIPQDWSNEDTICLKFRYKFLQNGSFFRILPTTGHYHPDVRWNSHRYERPYVWHDSLLNIRTDRPIQFQFQVDVPPVQIDNVEVLKRACVDHCSESPCRNGGTCVRRSAGHECLCTFGFKGPNCEIVDYCQRRPCQNGGTCVRISTRRTCSCPIEFKGIDCEIDRRCPTAPQYRRNIYRSEEIKNNPLPGSVVTYRCLAGYKLTGYSSMMATDITSVCVEGGRGSSWDTNLSAISCVEVVCSPPPLKVNQRLLRPKSLWRVGQEAIVQCDDGFEFSEENAVDTIACVRNGRWNDTFSGCREHIRTKLDLTILVPGNRLYDSRQLKAYDDWIKQIGRSAILKYDCQISLYQYGKVLRRRTGRFRNFFKEKIFHSATGLGDQNNLARWNSTRVHLKAKNLQLDLSDATIANANRARRKRKRLGSVEVVIILFESTIFVNDNANVLSDMTACMTFQGVFVFFGAGVVRSGGSLHASVTTKQIDIAAVPRTKKKACVHPSSRPSPRDSCRWRARGEQEFYGGDVVFLECPKNGKWRKSSVRMVCKISGIWHLRENNPCRKTSRT